MKTHALISANCLILLYTVQWTENLFYTVYSKILFYSPNLRLWTKLIPDFTICSLRNILGLCLGLELRSFLWPLTSSREPATSLWGRRWSRVVGRPLWSLISICWTRLEVEDRGVLGTEEACDEDGELVLEGLDEAEVRGSGAEGLKYFAEGGMLLGREEEDWDCVLDFLEAAGDSGGWRWRILEAMGELGGRDLLEAARHVPGSVERGRGAEIDEAGI